MNNCGKMEGDLNQEIERALKSEPPKAAGISIDEVQSLEQSLNIYHSELLYQNQELSRINQELENSKTRYEELYTQAPVSYVLLNIDGEIQSANHCFCKMMGLDVQKVNGRRISDFIAPQSQDLFHFFLLEISRDVHSRKQMELLFKSGDHFLDAEVHINHYREQGQDYIRVTIFDITRKKLLMTELDQEKERYRIIAEQTHDILFEYDIRQDTMSYSARFEEISGMDPVIQNFTHFTLTSGWIFQEDLPKFQLMMDEVRSGKKEISGDMRVRHAPNEYIWYRIIATVLYEETEPVRAVGTITNVENIIQENEMLRQAARTDSLTKLYNKEVTRREIQKFLLQEGRTGEHSLLIVDIDNFKYINDHLGHLFGDAVLVEVSNRLTENARPEDIVGRIGGDEFVLLLKNCGEEHAGEIAEIFCSSIKNIFSMERADCNISASIGICCFPKHGLTYNELFKKADIALYNSKGKGKSCYEIYQKGLQQIEPVSGLLNCYAAAEPYKERKYTNLQFVTNIIEILFEGKDVNSSIRLVLAMLGDYFKVGHVCLVEDIPELDCAKVTYEWYPAEESGKQHREIEDSFPRDILKNYSQMFDSEGLFCCYNIDIIKKDNFMLWQVINLAGIRTSLECAMQEGDKFLGFIALNDFESQRIWHQEDINSFKLIGKTIGAYLTKLRVMERTKHYEKIDMLTQAWNLNNFTLEAEKLFKTVRNYESALLYLDISNFKYFNDLYGYGEGDRILKEFSRNIERHLRGGEMSARVSADQFIMLLHFTKKEWFQDRLEQLVMDLSVLSKSREESYRLAVIAGVCFAGGGAEGITSLIDRANIARKSGKKSHKSTVVYYEGALEQKILQEKAVEDAMEAALAREEFYVEYQPKVLLKDNSLVGAEALIRWTSPDMGKVYPDIFIPVVEKNGFVTELDFYVLEQVCRKMQEWKQQGLPEIVIAVNFSRRHVEKKDSITRAKTILDRYGISPECIEIEITESVFTEKAEVLQDFMIQLKEVGFSISMDDFGTGYSSLNLLKELPIDVLKLDRQFFHGEGVSERERIIISNVAKMAQELGIVIVTEGVETVQQAEFLRDLGCEMAQGYLFARPMLADCLERVMAGEPMKNVYH